MTELADTTAWSWSRRRAYPDLRAAFDAALIDGELATCDMVRLELLHSARNPIEFGEIRSELEALPDCPIGEAQWARALEVYEQLSARGGAFQRSVKHPDLLIAAAAEAADVTLLKKKKEFRLRIQETFTRPNHKSISGRQRDHFLSSWLRDFSSVFFCACCILAFTESLPV